MERSSRAEDFSPLPPERKDVWGNLWTSTSPEIQSFASLVGLEIEELRLDYARMRMPHKPSLDQGPGGVVHGGAIASLADTVVVPAIGTYYDEPQMFSTIELHVRYLAPIFGEDAIAEGWVVKRGRSIVFCEAEICSDSGTVAARASLTYKISRFRSPGDGLAKNSSFVEASGSGTNGSDS